MRLKQAAFIALLDIHNDSVKNDAREINQHKTTLSDRTDLHLHSQRQDKRDRNFHNPVMTEADFVPAEQDSPTRPD